MKRSITVVMVFFLVFILALTVVWWVLGKFVPTSGTHHISTRVGTVLAVYDKLDTLGDYPPIIFSRNGNLYAVRLNGTDPVLLTNAGNNSDAYYLPEESKLLFIKEMHTAKDIDGGDVACIDFRTGQESVLLPASAFNPAWAAGNPVTGFILPELAPKADKLVVLEGHELYGGGPVLTASSAGKSLAMIDAYAVSYVLNPNGTGMAFTNDPAVTAPRYKVDPFVKTKF